MVPTKPEVGIWQVRRIGTDNAPGSADPVGRLADQSLAHASETAFWDISPAKSRHLAVRRAVGNGGDAAADVNVDQPSRDPVGRV